MKLDFKVIISLTLQQLKKPATVLKTIKSA